MSAYNTEGHYEPIIYGIDDKVRKAFIKKVYSILSLQLLITIGFCCMNMYIDSVRNFIIRTPSLFWFCLITSFILLIPLYCYRKNSPKNLILLTIWTLFESYTIGLVCSIYSATGNTELVVQAFGITFSVFIILTIFCFQTKYNFSFLGVGLGCCLWILLIWGIIASIIGFSTGFLYSLFGTIIFTLYILYDTSRLINDPNFNEDEYIFGAINLYLDVINLFLYILDLLGDRRN